MKSTAQHENWTRLASRSTRALTVVCLAALASEVKAGACRHAVAECALVSECDCICSGNLVHVRLDNGRLQKSFDCTYWTNCSLSVHTFFRALAGAHGLFVAVGGSYLDERAVIVTSPDGIAWTQRSSRTQNNLYSVAFGNGLFIAVGDSGTVCTSTDGIVWKAQRSGVDTLLAAVATGNNLFVAGGESGTILTSTNGINWTSGSIGAPIYVNKIVFKSGKFVVTSGDRIFASSDGRAWY